jgi:hypothetical protein
MAADHHQHGESSQPEPVVEDYLHLGLAIGRHIDGFVDAYYGPPEAAARVAAEPPVPPARLVQQARRLLAALAADGQLEPGRRAWLAAQARGLHTTARKLAGEDIGYLDEIADCYGVRPALVPEDDLAAAHRRLDEVLPGTGEIGPRYSQWRESQTVRPEVLGTAINQLAEDFRDRTRRAFGLPDGEAIEFELVTGQPWGGFNYYLGALRSRVAINTDLPVLSPVLGALVAHEAYPGHHTEHCRKEVGLVRRRRQLEETIFLVGTPQCLIAEGLADLGLEVIVGRRPEQVLAEHLHPLGVPYDADLIAQVSDVAEVLGSVRGNAAIMLHDRGAGVEEATAYMARWALTSEARAAKQVEFLVNPTWRAYTFCYIEGVRRCRDYVGGDPTRFERLVTEQILPSDLIAA